MVGNGFQPVCFGAEFGSVIIAVLIGLFGRFHCGLVSGGGFTDLFLQLGNRVYLCGRCAGCRCIGFGIAQLSLECVGGGFQCVCLGFQFRHIVCAFGFRCFGGFHCRLVRAGGLADLLLEFGHRIFCRGCRNGGAVFGITHCRFGLVGHGF